MTDVSCPQEIECCGRWFVVRRELGIAKRLEASFGPLRTLAQRLDSGDASIETVTGVYAIVTSGQSDAPDRVDIEQWVFAWGALPAARQVAFFTLSLVIGNDEAVRIHSRLAASADDVRRNAGGQRGPFDRAAASTGPGSAIWPSASAGRQ